jgi:putative endonuclease
MLSTILNDCFHKMTKPKQSLGQRGEQLARAYLTNKGYAILTTNWRCSHGELDIIARCGETVVFVEVRTRYADSTAPAFESINPRKQAKLAALAHLYLETAQLEDSPWRIDVIAVAIPPTGKPLLEHVENALDW